MDGYQVCRFMRSDPQLRHIPILFLTARVKPQDRINGFKAGGDDYLPKPFNIDELVLRVRAILRRTRPATAAAAGHAPAPAPRAAEPKPAPLNGSPAASAPVRSPVAPHCLAVESYVLDTHSFELHTPRRGKIRLTPLQYDLLYHLMTHPGEAFSPARLLDEVWDFPSGKGSPDLVRVHIKTLRSRIESDPNLPTFIRTIPGHGYTVGGLA